MHQEVAGLPFVDVGGVELFYTDDGDGEEPIVLVHGWGCDSHDWIWQIDPFVAAGHRVVAVDLRGHGRSSVPTAGYDPRQLASDVAALARQLGLGPVVAMGHSLGGFVVSALAIEHPESVRAVVAVDPGYGRDDALFDLAAALVQSLADSRDLGPALQAFEQMDSPATPAALRVWHRRRLLGTPFEVLLQSLRALSEQEGEFFSRTGAESYLPRRRCPVLSIQTSADQAAWEQTTMGHPCSTAVTWPDVGHWLHQERPDSFNRLVLEWIDRLRPFMA